MATYKTKPPTGLTITRKNGNFTFSWKNGDSDYKSGIEMESYYQNRKKNRVKIYNGKCDVSKTYRTQSVDLKKKFTKVYFFVRGKRAPFTQNDTNYTPDSSAWTRKEVAITKPPKPSLSFSLSNDKMNQGVFSWSVPAANKESNMAIFEHYEWQTKRIDHYNSSKMPKDWKNLPKENKGTGTKTSASKVWTEDSLRFVGKDYSFARCFRVRSVGPAGESKWAYIQHVYAIPKPATNVSASITKNLDGGYLCKAIWTAPRSVEYPVDIVNVEYAIGVPDTTSKVVDGTRVVEWKTPDNLSWSNAGSGGIKDTSGYDGLQFLIDETVESDQCVYVRVLSTHDYNTVTSDIVRVIGTDDTLPDVVINSIYPESSTHRVTINAQCQTSVADAFIAVYYRTSDMAANSYKTIGIIPRGESQVTIQCPDWGDKEVSFGFQAFLANYSPANIDYTTLTDYTIPKSTIKMASKNIVWSESSLPKAPGVVATPKDPSTISVIWTWDWEEANQAELSWADHEDAWMSTDQPSSFVVDSIYNSSWNISNLSVGTWYVRVRLNKVVGESVMYGLWSEIIPVKLSSAPAIPSLDLSSYVVAPDGELTCYWSYATTDGTEQMGADICEAFLDEETNKFTYGEPFLKTNTAKHITFEISSIGWTPSDKPHFLALKVTSASGETSAEWSVSKPVVVALPPTCEITNSSIVSEDIDTGGYESAYDPKYEPTSDIPISELVLTSDLDVDPNKIYYYEDGSVVLDPIIDDISTYYESVYVSGLVPGKTYYNRSGDDEPYTYSPVANPVIEDLPSYYELIDPPIIDPNKTYYTRTEDDGDYIYTEVVSPVVSDIQEYYLKVFDSLNYLKEMPLDLTISGAGGVNTIAIERLADYHINRPDETKRDGYEGETIYLASFNYDGDFSINNDDLIGYLDDGARYRLIVTSKDAQDQSAEDSIEFEVAWTHQAIIPEGSVTINEEYNVAILNPLLPEGETSEVGDVCDIYRLSIDKPKLIYSGAEFGSTYVDPYPTIGSEGGYRFVYRTNNGDYITEDNSIAWYNTPEHDNPTINRFTSIINYGDNMVFLPYNISLNNKWSKDFQQTVYLGGSIQGDWNPGVKRTGTINTVGIVDTDFGSPEDNAVIEQIRRLAEYTGVCHVRTPDGSNFAANVNVTEDRDEKMINKLAKYSLEITAIDSEALDGITYEEWLKRIGE